LILIFQQGVLVDRGTDLRE